MWDLNTINRINTAAVVLAAAGLPVRDAVAVATRLPKPINYVIRGQNDPGYVDCERKPYHLTQDGWRVFGGSWAECLVKAFEIGRDQDILTTGPGVLHQPLGQMRTEHLEILSELKRVTTGC